MKSRLIVSAIIKKDDTYLLGKKPKDIGPYPNTWQIIGGGVNLEKETAKEAIVREIKEETGIEVRDIKRIWFDEDDEPDKRGELTHYIFLVYEAYYASGEVKAQDDIAELQWFTQSELKKLSLPRPSVKLFKSLHLL